MRSEIIRKILPNGLKIIHVKNKSSRMSIQAHIKVGSQNETKENNGITHFVEHLIWQGSKNYTQKEIREYLRSIEGNFNAITTHKRTVHFISSKKRYFEELLKKFMDIICNPNFDIEEIERERNVILDEYKRYDDDPDDLLNKTIYSNIFKGHSLELPLIGTEENIKSFTREQLVKHYEKYYVANNMIIVVIGNIEDPFPLIEKYFTLPIGDLKDSKITIPDFNNKLKIKKKKNGITKNHLGIGFLSPKYTDQEYIAFETIDLLLSLGKSINLNDAVRQKLGLTYNIYSVNVPFQETGLFLIKTTIDSNNTDLAINSIFEELNKLLTIDKKEFNFIKKKCLKSYKKTDQYPFLLADKEVLNEFFEYKIANENRIKDLEKLSVEDIKIATKKLLDNYLISIIEPEN
jgi:predicted Zn-dependent peptidase